MPAVVALAEQLDAPVLTTFKAKVRSRTTTRSGAGAGAQRTPVASWLMNESDLLVVFGVVLEPHRHRRLQADHPGRPRPDGARPVPPGHRARARPRRRHRAAVDRGLPADRPTLDQRPDIAERWAIWRAEKTAAPRTTSTAGSTPPRCSRRWRGWYPTTP
jgi:hypothetical protein